MSEVLVPVKVLKPFSNYQEGDVVLLKEDVVRVLWSIDLVEVVDEIDKTIAEVDRALMDEKESEPLTELPENLYERAAFWIWYAETYVRKNSGAIDTAVLSVKLTKLATLKKKLQYLRALRLKKIMDAARLRPHSEPVRSLMTPDEAEVYEYLSDVAERWLA